MKKRAVVFALVVVAVITVGLGASAAVKSMLFCLPGFPGTSAQAQPYIDRMLRHLESELGQEAGSMHGTYLSDGEASVAKLKAEEPQLALLDPSVLVGHRKAMKMKVIAKVEIDGRGEEVYSIVTRADGPGALADLSGKTLSGAVVHDRRYALNVLLDKEVDDVNLVSQKRPLKSLRDVARGKADAAVVDSSVVVHMKELPFAGDLRIIHETKPVPAPAVVVMGDGAAQAKDIQKVLVGLCSNAEGKELCKSMTISSIKAAGDRDYKGLYSRYDR